MPQRLVFADTSAIYPLFAPGEALGDLCRSVLQEILKEYKVSLVTTTWVHYECLSRLRKHGIEFCRTFDRVIRHQGLRIGRVDERLEERGLEMFWQYEDKSWGITDCISFSYMLGNNIYYAFALDEHFRQAGFFPLLDSRPGYPTKSYSSLNFL